MIVLTTVFYRGFVVLPEAQDDLCVERRQTARRRAEEIKLAKGQSTGAISRSLFAQCNLERKKIKTLYSLIMLFLVLCRPGSSRCLLSSRFAFTAFPLP